MLSRDPCHTWWQQSSSEGTISTQQIMHLFIQTIVEHKTFAPLLCLIPDSLALLSAAWLPAMVHSSLCTCGHSHRGRPYPCRLLLMLRLPLLLLCLSFWLAL